MGRVNIAGLVAGLVLAALATVAHARSGTAPPPGRPTDPETLKAYDVLERHCARCHQSGALKRPKPAADLANLLRLDEVAHDPHLVRPGNPDASRIYTLMLGRRMPYDVHQEGANREPPSPEDIDTLRAWIAGLPPQQPGLCAKRQPVSADAQHIAIARDRAALSGESAVRARYLSLTNLWNECASTAYLDAARRAAVAAEAREFLRP